MPGRVIYKIPAIINSYNFSYGYRVVRNGRKGDRIGKEIPLPELVD